MGGVIFSYRDNEPVVSRRVFLFDRFYPALLKPALKIMMSILLYRPSFSADITNRFLGGAIWREEAY